MTRGGGSGDTTTTQTAGNNGQQRSSTGSSGFAQLGPVEAYFGIPYASPPTQTRRFMPPVTPPHWRGVRLANRPGPVCPQVLPDLGNGTTKQGQSAQRQDFLRRVLPYMRNQSEDCLYLNIYVPYNPGAQPSSGSLPSTQSSSSSSSTTTAQSSSSVSGKYPVIVFIGGESYDWDAGNPHDGSILASFGQVIVVTLNYRLGVLGFLPAVVDGTVRGNYGLMDQVAALHWIQENIGDLSGDTHNVTVVGHGFGASCVHLLMISPMAKGLFSRVALMSGSALGPAAIARDADTYARHLAKAINCPNFDNVVMVDCLRQKSVAEIMSVDLMVPQYLSAFGPIVDGIVIAQEPRQLMFRRTGGAVNIGGTAGSGGSSGGSDSSPTTTASAAQNYVLSMAGQQPIDMLFGVTRVETPFIFTANEERHGIDLARRERILRTLVRNLFDYHQQAILLTLINEYTDWNRPIEHPINLLDSTADILGDALTVAPMVETGDLHTKWTSSSTGTGSSSSSTAAHTGANSDSNRQHKTFFYVFVYQSEDGNKQLNQRLGCLHGEELAYLFGAPLAVQLLGRTLGHFAVNYSKPEVTLSEAVMTYWTNFAKYGDPNGADPSDTPSQPAPAPHQTSSANERKGRFDGVQWPLYDTVQKKYLMIGMKPKVRDHYHSHRLSFWLQLIPDLHKPGDEDVYLRHHLLQDHENPLTYDGVVRQIAFKFLQPLPTVPHGSSAAAGGRQQRRPTITSLLNNNNKNVNNDDNSIVNGVVSVITSEAADDEGLAKRLDKHNNSTTATALSTTTTTANNSTADNGYTTALSVTIAIGCSLLILNMLIFAGVYYQLERNAKKRSVTALGGADGDTTGRCLGGGAISIASGGHNHLVVMPNAAGAHYHHHQHLNDELSHTDESSALMLMSVHNKRSSVGCRQQQQQLPAINCSSSPISQLSSPSSTIGPPIVYQTHNNNTNTNTNSLTRRSGYSGQQSYGKLSKLSLDSVPEQQQQLPVPLHDCSISDYIGGVGSGIDSIGTVSDQLDHYTQQQQQHQHHVQHLTQQQQHQELELNSVGGGGAISIENRNQIRI
ncbi:neuroligin-4, X-linked-like [Oppia nitens]|uniref:neuroligin-4, X-linked-like n=1 Tax=Oppia nitens TaxID=1686743 RepID=UPI0023DC0F12|nr:neuroligin-4, X-linked-like [Oppia nitens]